MALAWSSVARAQTGPRTAVQAIPLDAAVAAGAPAVPLTPLEAATKLLRHGDYAEALAAAQTGRQGRYFQRRSWWLLQGDALMALGKYEDAYGVLTDNLRYVPNSLAMLLMIRQCCLYTGRDAEAARTLKEITTRLTDRSGNDRSPAFLAEMGQAALVIGADPKLILENFLKPGQQSDPPIRDLLPRRRSGWRSTSTITASLRAPSWRARRNSPTTRIFSGAWPCPIGPATPTRSRNM